jgi:hypothetical protein
MEYKKIHNKGQAQIFKNNHLEYLTKTHPLVIWGIYLPIIILFPYYSYFKLGYAALTIFLVLLSGVLFLTF